MIKHLLTEEQRDALQEIANVGMGTAGAKLAVLLDRFVKLSIPRIYLVDCDQLKGEIEGLLGGHADITAFRQSFRCDIAGEVMVFFGRDETSELSQALHGPAVSTVSTGEHASPAPDELLFEIANLLTGACISGLLEPLGRMPTFSAPRAIGAGRFVNDVVDPGKLTLNRALLLDINIRIEDSGFNAHLVALMAEAAIDRLCAALAEFLISL